MTHKVEAIDYLRGIAILALVFLHILLPLKIMHPTDYSAIPFLYYARDLFNLSIVTIIICSGFSLYISVEGQKYVGIYDFYKKRLKRIIQPWFVYVVVSFLFYGILSLFFRPLREELLANFSFLKVWNFLGIPMAWIALKWIVILMVILAFLFPLLIYIYERKPHLIAVMVFFYILSSIVSIKYGVDVYQYENLKLSFVSMFVFPISFILGYSLLFLVGFYLEQLYNEHKLMKKELKVTFNSIFLFLLVYVLYKLAGLSTEISLNKFPPSPFYLSFGIMVTFILLNIFFAYKHFIQINLRRVLSFFSYNSYWAYLWSLLFLFVVSYMFSFLTFINIYLRAVLEFIFTCFLIAIIIFFQKRFIRIEIRLEKHHF